MFYIITTILAVLVHTFNLIGLPQIYKHGLKKKGKLMIEEKESIIKTLCRYIIDFIPFINVMTLFLNLFVDGCLIAFYDKLLDRYSDTYEYDYVKRRYERVEQDKKDIVDALTLDGADNKEIESEMKQIEKSAGKKEKGDFTCNDPIFTKKEYDWACAYSDAANFLDGLSLDITLDEKTKEKIVNELIGYVRKFELYDKIEASFEEDEERDTNNYVEPERDEFVSNKVLEVINKHL